MIYLYRFEARYADGEVLGGGLSVSPQLASGYEGQTRTLWLLTNREEPVSLSSSDPFVIPFLHRAGYTGTPTTWTFEPTLVQHNGLRLDNESASGELSVRLPAEHDIPQLYALDAPSAQVWLTLAVMDTPTSEPLVMWVGRVKGVEFDEVSCALTLAPLSDVFKRPGLTVKHPRVAYGVLQDHVDYVSDVAGSPRYFRWREDGFVEAIDDNRTVVAVNAAANRPDGFFSNGLIFVGSWYPRLSGADSHCPRPKDPGSATNKSWMPSGGNRRGVVSHEGATLTLATRLPSTVAVGDKVTLFCGVPEGFAEYKERFGSVALYNGHPYIPEKNPYKDGIR